MNKVIAKIGGEYEKKYAGPYAHYIPGNKDAGGGQYQKKYMPQSSDSETSPAGQAASQDSGMSTGSGYENGAKRLDPEGPNAGMTSGQGAGGKFEKYAGPYQHYIPGQPGEAAVALASEPALERPAAHGAERLLDVSAEAGPSKETNE